RKAIVMSPWLEGLLLQLLCELDTIAREDGKDLSYQTIRQNLPVIRNWLLGKNDLLGTVPSESAAFILQAVLNHARLQKDSKMERSVRDFVIKQIKNWKPSSTSID